jgi:hypothetical protein
VLSEVFHDQIKFVSLIRVNEVDYLIVKVDKVHLLVLPWTIKGEKQVQDKFIVYFIVFST